MIVKKDRIKAMAKEIAVGYRLQSAFCVKLCKIVNDEDEKQIKQIVKDAMERAKANGRKSLMPYDI